LETTEKKAEFFTFPVLLLTDCFSNIKVVCDQIINYSIFANFLKLSDGTEIDRIIASANYFRVTLGDPERTLETGETLFYSLPNGLPICSVAIRLVWKFRNEDKTEFEIACFLAFAALKSIIGTKPFVKTTNEFLLARMGGFASKIDVSELLPEPLAKYATRRKLDKIKFDLKENWNVNIYAFRTRGFYVSIDKIFSLDRLVLEAEKNRIKFKVKQQQNKISEARNRVLIHLNN